VRVRRKCDCGCGEQFICDKDSERTTIAGHVKKPALVSAPPEPEVRKRRARVRELKEEPTIESGIPVPDSRRGASPFNALAQWMKPGDSVLIEEELSKALGAAIRKDGGKVGSAPIKVASCACGAYRRRSPSREYVS
jgi:hypothetical protein